LKVLEQAVFKKLTVPDQSQTPEALEDGTILETAIWMEAAAGTGVPKGLPYSGNLYEDRPSSYEDTSSRDWSNILVTNQPPPDPPLSCSDIAAILPNKIAAYHLFDHYVNNLNWIYHAVHVPTLRQQLASIYDHIETRRKPKFFHLALIATILAVTAYFKSGSSVATSTRTTREESLADSTKWGLLAQRALSEANHDTSPTLETLQATIIMSQFLPNYGQSTSFTATLAHSAHMLQLHKVDSAKNRKIREARL
jgi:hypothetical protein